MLSRRNRSAPDAHRFAAAAPMGLGRAIAAGLWLATCACSPGTAPRNLLLVIWDTTRADRLSCYGYERETTPTLDKLAREGLRFDQIYAQSSLTPVSAATLLSGALPFRHGVRSLFVVGKETMSDEVASLPEMLAERGLRTAAFVSAKPMGSHYGLARGFESYHDDLSATAERHGASRFGDSPQRPGDETVDLALDWLAEHGTQSFALMVHLFDAHDPSFVPPREFLAERVSFELPSALGRIGAHYKVFANLENRSELYDAELSFMDAQLARLLERLEELRIAEQTLVVLVADHGEAFGEHGYWTHGLLHQEQLRVPVVLRGPRIPAGRVIEERGRLVDLMPTLIDLFDLPRPAGHLDGASLLPLLDRPEGEARPIYAEVHHASGDPRGRETELYSLTVGRWKYVHHPTTGEHELYDLEADPGELDNRFTPENAEARRLRSRIEAMGAVDGVVPDLSELDEQDLIALRRLGYL